MWPRAGTSSATFAAICGYISPGPADSSTSPIRAVAVTDPSTLPVSHGGVIARFSGTPNVPPAYSSPRISALVAASSTR